MDELITTETNIIEGNIVAKTEPTEITNTLSNKVLIIFLGESYRLGGQHNRNKGSTKSYDAQILAYQSHIEFIKNLKLKHNINTDIYISTYNTKYNEDTLKIYNELNIIGYDFYKNLQGLHGLFHKTVKKVKDINNYNFICYIRIDLQLKPALSEIFNPNWETIRFPMVHYIGRESIHGHPQISDTMLFLPKKYYKYIRNIKLYHPEHHAWLYLMTQTDLTIYDLDTMLNTYHDSDSAKDWNPLYYIVNRCQNKSFHSVDHIFDKYHFYKRYNPKYNPYKNRINLQKN